MFGVYGRGPSQPTVDDAPSQAEIEREIKKLKEDSAKDVQRQLEQQRAAARKARAEEGVKRVAEDVEGGLKPVLKAAEQRVETIVKDAEADVRGVRAFKGRAERAGNGA